MPDRAGILKYVNDLLDQAINKYTVRKINHHHHHHYYHHYTKALHWGRRQGGETAQARYRLGLVLNPILEVFDRQHTHSYGQEVICGEVCRVSTSCLGHSTVTYHNSGRKGFYF